MCCKSHAYPSSQLITSRIRLSFSSVKVKFPSASQTGAKANSRVIQSSFCSSASNARSIGELDLYRCRWGSCCLPGDRLPSDTLLLLSPIPSYSYLPYHRDCIMSLYSARGPAKLSKPMHQTNLPKTYLQHWMIQTSALLILQKAIWSTSLVAAVANSKSS